MFGLTQFLFHTINRITIIMIYLFSIALVTIITIKVNGVEIIILKSSYTIIIV